MAWADPADTHNPTTGNAIPASWGDAVNAAVQWLAGDASNPKPSCAVYNSANLTITNNTNTACTFNSERWDNGGCHSTASNTSRITVPSGGDGIWLVGGAVRWSNTDTDGTRQVQLRVNGTLYIAIQECIGTAGDTHMTVSKLVPLAAADYVELVVYQNSGSSIDVVSTSAYSPEFWAIWQAL